MRDRQKGEPRPRGPPPCPVHVVLYHNQERDTMATQDDIVTAGLLTLATSGFLVAGQEGQLTYPDGLLRDILTLLIGSPVDEADAFRALLATFDSLFSTGWFSAADIAAAALAWEQAAYARPPEPSSLRHARLQLRRDEQPPSTNRGVTRKPSGEKTVLDLGSDTYVTGSE